MRLVHPVFRYAAVVGLSLMLAAPALAVPVETVTTPKPNGWVNDTVDLLSSATKAEINRQVAQLEAKNQAEIIVLTVADTAPYTSPREFGLKWFEHWKLGKKGLDNGVLFLYSQKENRLEIVTGWGVMDIFPDGQVTALLKQTVRPKINEGQYNAAMLTGTEQIISVMQAYEPHPSPHQSLGNEIWVYIAMVSVVVLLILVASSQKSSRRSYRSHGYSASGGGSCGGWDGGSGDSGGGGDGGGGDGGGGDGGGGD